MSISVGLTSISDLENRDEDEDVNREQASKSRSASYPKNPFLPSSAPLNYAGEKT